MSAALSAEQTRQIIDLAKACRRTAERSATASGARFAEALADDEAAFCAFVTAVYEATADTAALVGLLAHS